MKKSHNVNKTLHLGKCCIYMLFQDDLPSKKPPKPSPAFNFTSNQNLRYLLDIWELGLGFILKELAIGVKQNPFLCLGQSELPIDINLHLQYDPINVYFDSKM